MSESAKSYMQYLASMSPTNLQQLRDAADMMLETHGMLPNPCDMEASRLSRMAIGFLSTSMTSFVAAHFTAGVVSDEGEFDINFEHLLRAVIFPSLSSVGLITEKEKDTENHIWALRICMQVLALGGWNISISPVEESDKFFIRHVLGISTEHTFDDRPGSYSDVTTSVMSIPFYRHILRVRKKSANQPESV